MLATNDWRLMFEKALRRASNTVGYDLRPILTTKTPAIDILDLAVRDLMARQSDVTFLQIGAHDGLRNDPISYYIRKYRWHGLLVEPQPAVFAKLKENYQNVPGLIFENVAIAPQEGTLRLYCFKNASPNEYATMLASAKRHHLSLNGDQVRGEIAAIDVPARTTSSLLEKHGLQNLDVLQIDTEGYDFTILKSFDFRIAKPQIIHFENNFLNSRERNEALSLLGAEGYATMELGIDTLAVQQSTAHAQERLELSKIIRA